MDRRFLIKLAKQIEPFLSLIHAPGALLAGRSQDTLKALFSPLVGEYSKKSKSAYLTYETYPKDIYYPCLKWGNESDVAIILQGPVVLDDGFTENSIRLYHHQYPLAKIIVSTWEENVDQNFVSICSDLETNLIINDKGSVLNGGPCNINYQIITTKNAIKKALELGCKYCLKQRTDMRFYMPGMIQFFKNLVRIFPSTMNDDKQKSRIVFLSQGSMLYLPYFVNGLFAMGDTGDLLNMYDIDLDTRDPSFHSLYADEEYEFLRTFYSRIESGASLPYMEFENLDELFFKFYFPECYITHHYHMFLNSDDRQNLVDRYHSFLKSCAIIVDHQPLRMLWYSGGKRGQRIIEERHIGSLNFGSWLDLYLDQ